MMRERNPAPSMAESLLVPFAAHLAERLGLHFPRERWHELEVATRRAAHDLGFSDVDACVRKLLSEPWSRHEVDVFASHLTVGETYFFRDRAVFECLERLTLAELVAARRATDRRLRIWSTGCSSGEEAYSIAMLIATLLPDLDEWNVSILATDINPRVLEKARRGVYNEWSFRDAPPGIKERFFTRKTNGRFEIAERIKSLVTFNHLNLADHAYPRLATNTCAMDVVFCRNTLMYFQPARSRELISRLSLSLLEGGWLYLSPVDAPMMAAPQLEEVMFPGATAYRKSSALKPLESKPPSRPAATPVALAPRARPASNPVARPALAPIRPPPVEAPPSAPAPEAGPGKVANELYEQGDYAEVIVLLHERLERGPADGATLALLARSYANQGRLADAERWCREAVAADRFEPAWPYLLSTILQERNDLAAAEAALGQALYLDPEHALAHFALGNLLRRRGKTAAAQRHLRNALALLEQRGHDEVLAHADGLTAGRLADVIRGMTASEVVR